jgi:hypothetical protein
LFVNYPAEPAGKTRAIDREETSNRARAAPRTDPQAQTDNGNGAEEDEQVGRIAIRPTGKAVVS